MKLIVCMDDKNGIAPIPELTGRKVSRKMERKQKSQS